MRRNPNFKSKIGAATSLNAGQTRAMKD